MDQAPELTEERITETKALAEKVACRPGDGRCYALSYSVNDALTTCTLKKRCKVGCEPRRPGEPMDDYKKHLLGELSTRSRDNVLSLLRCATRDPDRHEVRSGKSGIKSKPWSIEVVLPPGNPPCAPIAEDWDLGYWLTEQDFLEFGELGAHGPLRFRAGILQWYRETHPATDADIQEAIGRHFYELGTANDYEDSLVPFDLATLAGDLGYPPDRVQSNVRALARSGVLRNDGPGGAGVPPYYVLTELGFRWVGGGSRPISVSPRVLMLV